NRRRTAPFGSNPGGACETAPELSHWKIATVTVWHIGCICTFNTLARCWVSKATLPTRTGRTSALSNRAVAFFFGDEQAMPAQWEKLDEPFDRFTSQRQLEGAAGLLLVLRHGLHHLGDVRPPRALHFKADHAHTHPGRLSGRRASAGCL